MGQAGPAARGQARRKARNRGQIRSVTPRTAGTDPDGSPPRTAVTTHSQIRRHPYGHRHLFRSVRDLVCFPVCCSWKSGESGSRSSAWLPAWLPVVLRPRHLGALVLVTTSAPAPVRRPRYCPAQPTGFSDPLADRRAGCSGIEADARSLPSVNPVIAAALIGVGGSVIVAVVGFLTTRAITGETIRWVR